MFKRLIAWIKSCFAGSIAVSDQNRGKINVDIADKKAMTTATMTAEEIAKELAALLKDESEESNNG